MIDTPITDRATTHCTAEGWELHECTRAEVARKLEVENTRLLSFLASITAPVGYSALQEKCVLIEAENTRLRSVMNWEARRMSVGSAALLDRAIHKTEEK